MEWIYQLSQFAIAGTMNNGCTLSVNVLLTDDSPPGDLACRWMKNLV